MLHPAITDYIDTLENPAGAFRTLGEPAVERDVYGALQFHAGNSAAIFNYPDEGGRRRFIKCYIRPNPHLRTIYEYVERHAPTILPEARLLPGEMFVHTLGGAAGWVDVVEGAWIDGETLAAAVARAARKGDGERLGALAAAFDALWETLSAAEWAHGDLKPENIIVRSGALPALVLVDCDAMWIPALAGRNSAELGTPGYRHPSRTAAQFDKSIDDHPARLISTALHELAEAPRFWPLYTTFEEWLEKKR